MGIIKAFAGAISSTFADQWKDIITAEYFDEHTVVTPGVLKSVSKGAGENTKGTDGVITKGSKIYVPENTAAFIFSQAGIENIITDPGGYEYQEGEASIFSGDGLKKSIFGQIWSRVEFGGITSVQKEVAFVNLREIRDIKFGTRGPQVYNDIFYGCDLEIYAYGSFTVQVVDAQKFIQNFVPPSTRSYSFDDPRVREQLVSEFLQSFITSLNGLSQTYRVSQIPSQANALSLAIASDKQNAGSWEERFGFKLIKASIENIEFSPQSRELVNNYNSRRMNISAYENTSQRAANIAAQQSIAKGIEDHGFGEMGNMILGMNMAQGISPTNAQPTAPTMSLDERIDTIKKYKELLDMGILTEEEFNVKKKELMGL